MVSVLWGRKSSLDHETITTADSMFATVPLNPSNKAIVLYTVSQRGRESVSVCILENTHAWDSLTFHFMCLKLQNWVLKCGTVPSFTGAAGYSSAIFFTPNQGKLPVLERKQQPLRRLKIMKISLSGPGVGAFSGWQSPSNQCLTIPLCKLMLSFCPLVSDIPLSEVLKD